MPVPRYSEVEQASTLMDALRRPWWRKTPHEVERLSADFGDGIVLNISLAFPLSNGILLSSNDARVVRDSIVDFLCIQGIPGIMGGKPSSGKTDRAKLLTACRIIDGLLVRDKSHRLAKFGLRGVTDSDLTTVLLASAARNRTITGIYDWPARLTELLRKTIRTLPNGLVQHWSAREPAVTATTPLEGRELKLSDSEISLSRILILARAEELCGHFNRIDIAKSNAVLDSLKRELYAGTLLGCSGHCADLTFPYELRMVTLASNRREKSGVPVSLAMEEETAAHGSVDKYRNSILSAAALSFVGNTFPTSTLKVISHVDISAAVPLKNPQGFRHVPPHVVATCLRKAIDFFYSTAPIILGEIEKMAARGEDFRYFSANQMSSRVRKLGVSRWLIPATVQGSDYARQVRSSPGLWDMLTVVYGASSFIVGALEALRRGEMSDLRKHDLDEENNYLKVLTRKSGFGDLRRVDELPLPKVANDVLSRLRSFIDRVDPSHELIFAVLGKRGRFRRTADTIDNCVDTFLDYIDSPTDSIGRRYYIRQHQLRKFFVEVFFRCCGFAGMDTLRWFIRHLNLHQIWAYIQLTIPRSEMRQHLSGVAAPLIRNEDSHMAPLIHYLRQRFNIYDFKALSEEELSELLIDVQEDSSVEFQMVFPDGDESDTFHLGVLVWGDAK